MIARMEDSRNLLHDVMAVTSTLATALENLLLDPHQVPSAQSGRRMSVEELMNDLIRRPSSTGSLLSSHSSPHSSMGSIHQHSNNDMHDPSTIQDTVASPGTKRSRELDSNKESRKAMKTTTEGLSAHFAAHCALDATQVLQDTEMEVTPVQHDDKKQRKIKPLRRPPSFLMRKSAEEAGIGSLMSPPANDTSLVPVSVAEIRSILNEMQVTLTGEFLYSFRRLDLAGKLGFWRQWMNGKQERWSAMLLKQSTLSPRILMKAMGPDVAALTQDFDRIVVPLRELLVQMNLDFLSELRRAVELLSREHLESLLLCLAETFDFCGLAVAPMPSSLRLQFLRLLIPTLAHFMNLHLRHFDAVVHRQSKFRVLDHYDHFLKVLKSLKLVLASSALSPSNSPRDSPVENEDALLECPSLDLFNRLLVESCLRFLTHVAAAHAAATSSETSRSLWIPFTLSFVASIAEVVGLLARFIAPSPPRLDPLLRDELRLQGIYQSLQQSLHVS